MEEIKNKKWINVLEREPDIKNDGSEDVGPFVQKIIDETEFCVLYFPKGKYLFKTGVTIAKEITLLGDSDSSTSATQFITHGIPNISIITLIGRKQCIKNISFYSDSCEVLVNDEPPTKGKPQYHYEIDVKLDGVSAITTDDIGDTHRGLGHYENLYISGFSDIGIQIPYYAISNDITVSSCGLGIDTGTDVIISNSRISKCKNRMRMRTGTSINNVKIEKIQEVGLESSQIENLEGYGCYKINNITIDQCGHCGFLFNLIRDTYISGIIRRCGQRYYNTDYDTYLKIKDKKEKAFSLLAGNYFTNCHVNLVSDNKDNWDDGLEYEHKVYVFEILQIPNATLKCIMDDYNYIVKAVNGGGNLRFQNNFNDYIFIDSSKPEIVNGISTMQHHENGNLLLLNSGTLRFGDVNKKKGIFKSQAGLIVKSTDSDISQIKSTYGEKWVNIGSELIGEETVYYYKYTS
ncbi:glycoside hydrolase family 55 protein [Clostridioides difficile]|nr:glycoside hydrolase family 55 protein [Clostridioides difficile]